MPPVFAHGRLRLYLLKLLDESPRHGYEVIRLLEERFQGLYAPSAGTVYPRLAKLEAEGLVTHTTEGGRKVYSLTDEGRAELAGRGGELAELELEIRDSVAALASDIRADVSGSASDLRREIREAAQQARAQGRPDADGGGPEPAAEGAFGDHDAWRQAKEEFRRAKEEWKEQARRAKDERRRAEQEARRAREQARAAQAFAREEVQQALRRVQEQAQERVRSGDWAGAVREALSEVSREVGRFTGGPHTDDHTGREGASRPPEDDVRPRGERPHGEHVSGAGAPGARTSDERGHDGHAAGSGPGRAAADEVAAGRAGPGADRAASGRVRAGEPPLPEWAEEPPGPDPARDFDRLLDRFRDDLRDAARDHGIGPEQVRRARHRLAETATEIGGLLREPTERGPEK
ncbi:helix-turn-helix transcriptional regulator [Streptomyces sp. NPDC014733]|uniref:helix-turn-helix transcriptional regulator n=1 Tax=Streptomyces sp. NPDC014733 TaxID=3364885 RepID=UPI0036FA242F